ncbi:nitrite reductase small subunit NirD [Microbispora bryophytorum]|uniref:nitrite reductase small subunit NirD n=1 Tax=Microbispora bryophytorum TaxID=1460882 RepID=UPI0033E5BA80
MTILDASPALAGHWIPVCPYTDLLPEQGAAVLVDDRQVAVFRTFDGALYALGNLDPFSGAQVMSRGIVGTRNGEPTVASPMHKQVFSLVTGVCADGSGVTVPTYAVRVTDGTVEVSVV